MKETSKEAHYSPLEKRVYVLIGCIPAITVLTISMFLLYSDYVINDYSFWDKSWHLSNVENTSYDAQVECVHSDYLSDRQKFPSCAPKHCFRYFTDFHINKIEGSALLSMAKKGWSFGDDSDSFSKLNIETGVVTKGSSQVKLTENLFSDEELKVYNEVKQKILKHVQQKFNAQNLHLTTQNVFTKYSNNEPKSKNLEYWHPEVDKYSSNVHYSVVLFLNDFMTEFFRSRFVFKNTDNQTVLTVQPKLARVMVYSPGSENEHYFERLETGFSYSLSIPLTCDKN